MPDRRQQNHSIHSPLSQRQPHAPDWETLKLRRELTLIKRDAVYTLKEVSLFLGRTPEFWRTVFGQDERCYVHTNLGTGARRYRLISVPGYVIIESLQKTRIRGEEARREE